MSDILFFAKSSCSIFKREFLIRASGNYFLVMRGFQLLLFDEIQVSTCVLCDDEAVGL